MAGNNDASSKNWRGIYVTRGMRFRLSGLTFRIGNDGSFEGGPVEATVSLNLFVYWIEIALSHLFNAEEAHAELLETLGSGEDEQDSLPLERDFSSSMQCIGALAFALDAFYAMVRDYIPVPDQEIKSWRRNRTPRPKQIAEVLRRGFSIGSKSFATMREHLIELFKWRDWCVHPPAGFDKPVRYDELRVATEWRFVAFRFANARNALGIALSIVAQLLENPKPVYPKLVEHCQELSPMVMPLVGKWEKKYGQLYERAAPTDYVDSEQE